MLCARPMPDSSIPPHHTGIEFRLAEIVHAPRGGVAADAAELDIDDAARPGLDSGARVVECRGCIRRGRSAYRAGAAAATWEKMSSQPSGCSIMIR